MQMKTKGGDLMASLNWNGNAKRHTAGDAKAAMRHDDKDKRMEHSHSNEDIDKTRTPLNADVTGMTYEEACKVYDRKMEEYKEKSVRRVKDKETGEQKIVHMPIRKDAVTFLDLTLSTPRDLPPEKEDQWFADVRDVINKHYKADVCLDIKIHRDEIHTYTDPETKRRVTSRAHGHCWVMPEIDGKLNAKRFCSRGNITHINYEIDAMTREKYQCVFLTGDKSKNRGYQTAEQLKRRSDEAQRQAEAEMNFINDHEEYSDIIAEDLNAIQSNTERNNELRQQAAAEQRNLDEIRRQIVADQQTLENLRRQEKDKQAQAVQEAQRAQRATERAQKAAQEAKEAVERAQAEKGIVAGISPDEINDRMAGYRRTLRGEVKIPEEDLRDLVARATAYESIDQAYESINQRFDERKRQIQDAETKRTAELAAKIRELEVERDQAKREAVRAKHHAEALQAFIAEIGSRGPLAGRRKFLARWQEKFIATTTHRDNGTLSIDQLIGPASARAEYENFCREHRLTKPEEQQHSRTRDRSNDLER